ncbi:MAG: 50S ribosomal protein L22 [Pseudomonadales bacterium]|nr:50S ribosomal protein L22 [Pseudomonadales bacterium]
MAASVQAVAKGVRLSPQKARLVVDQIRGKQVQEAVEILQYMPQKGATPVLKVLESAIANAENNESMDIDELRVAEIWVGDALTATRTRPRARGRADRFFKRSCHITVRVSEG